MRASRGAAKKKLRITLISFLQISQELNLTGSAALSKSPLSVAIAEESAPMLCGDRALCLVCLILRSILPVR
ncbi:hypothetical protein C8J27_11345 [Rhodobacter aestuarii]|uniref:Uncharacterized protein n=1 Tax=Rhodobacter aestuarii TaxID=453582 RepID=A0A1N7QCL9_9RHOB|nr:hypothetical protein C8J27_11345 [Rhodobacter aestuarii]SIT20307.1 hypothetical protein SAMN05421580_11544 [Rhodobacter aestuarii]